MAGIIITTTPNNFIVDFNRLNTDVSPEKMQRHKSDVAFDKYENLIKVEVKGSRSWDITNIEADSKTYDLTLVESLDGTPVNAMTLDVFYAEIVAKLG